MQLIILGPPGVGKGTLSDMLAEKYKIPHVSTGEIFRSEINSGNSELKQFVEKGMLVPDSIVNKVIERALKQDIYKEGFILDGYPRTVDQADFVANVVWKLKKKIDIVIDLAVSEDILVTRLLQRRTCSKCGTLYNLETMKPRKKDTCNKCGSALEQRKDDEPDTVRNRIHVYNVETAPLIDYYKKKKMIVDIDASKTPEEVYDDVVKALEEHGLVPKEAPEEKSPEPKPQKPRSSSKNPRRK